MKVTAIFTFLAGLIELIRQWFGKAAQEKKDKQDAAQKTSDKIFMLLAVLIFLGGCNSVRLGDVPVVLDPGDYQPVKAGQQFTPQRDGVYFSSYGAKMWIRSKLFEYEMNRYGFNREEKE